MNDIEPAAEPAAAPLQTRCPECLTTFRLPPALLEVAEGRVRCSRCSCIFDGREQMVPAPAAAPRMPDPDLSDDEIPDPGVVYGLEEPEPRPRRSPSATLAYLLLIPLLLVVLGWQAWYGLREPLLASPTARPWIERACDTIGCAVPARRDVARIEILGRDVRSHPRIEQALLIDVTMINRAGFAQPFPDLGLAFSSVDGQWSAQRLFTPDEYLADGAADARLMPPDVPVQAILELVDPGSEAASFRFELH